MEPSIVKGHADLPKVVLSYPGGDSAEVYLHGAHVTSWIPASTAEETIFVSKEAVFKPPKAIRGGIPVCFPQFSDMGPLAAHGFARNSLFEVERGDPTQVTLVLRPREEDLEKYPHKFELRVTVSLSPNTLTQTMELRNTGSSSIEFTCALHSYFCVGDITKTHVRHLQGVDYLDNLQSREKSTEASDSVQFSGELDRIYCGAPDVLEIVDGSTDRVVVVEKSGFPDAVVWNPWIDKAASIKDLGNDEYKEMLCVEPAVAGSGPVKVNPGSVWTGNQKLSVQ